VPPGETAHARSRSAGESSTGHRRDFIALGARRYTGDVLARPRLALLIVLGAVLALWVLFVAPQLADRRAGDAAGGSAEPLAALTEASGWLDGGPVPADSLRGRTVLLVAWSDADPLSLRSLREAEAWQLAYGRFGLRVVGVHVPEFAFSADSATPARALRRLGVHLPVALDAGSRVGSRLGVGEELPLWVVVGADGRRVLAAAGDHAAEVQRGVLQALQHSRQDSRLLLPPAPSGAAPAARRRVYCGTSRVAGGPLANANPGETRTFTAQFRFQEQGQALTPYPVGRWTPSADGLTSARGGAADYVAIRYDGGRVDAVLGALAHARVWVMCDDGWLPAVERGDDVHADARGATFVEVSEPRPYAIVRGGGAHVLRLSPEGPGVTYYLFEFGGE